MSISQPYAEELARQVDELEIENSLLRAEVERLRTNNDVRKVEIKRLRTALREIVTEMESDDIATAQSIADIARAVLEGK